MPENFEFVFFTIYVKQCFVAYSCPMRCTFYYFTLKATYFDYLNVHLFNPLFRLLFLSNVKFSHNKMKAVIAKQMNLNLNKLDNQ